MNDISNNRLHFFVRIMKIIHAKFKWDILRYTGEHFILLQNNRKVHLRDIHIFESHKELAVEMSATLKNSVVVWWVDNVFRIRKCTRKYLHEWYLSNRAPEEHRISPIKLQTSLILGTPSVTHARACIVN